MDEELKRYLDEINKKLDAILNALSIKPASDVYEKEPSDIGKVIEEIEKLEEELLNEIKEKGWQFIYKSYLIKKLKEKNLTIEDFIKHSKYFYEKEKDKFYPI
ncbi:MAG: hypothetical protein ACP5GJ_02700 [Nanopusillaceae archaeon]